MTRLLPAIVALLLLVACATRPDRAHVDSLGGDAMGSTWTVKLVRTDAAPDLATLQAGIQSQLDTVDLQMSRNRTGDGLRIRHVGPWPDDIW